MTGPLIRSRQRQQGSILIFAALGLSLAVILLSITDMGLLFYYKREYQKTADLAALAGARQISSSCSAAQSAASANAVSNLANRVYNTPAVVCGTWVARPTPSFIDNAVSPNAIRVTISGTAPRVLPFTAARTVSSSAIGALGSPVAIFSVGTAVVRVGGDSVLGSTLKSLGLNLNGTSLVGYDGLANVQITPRGLLQQLGIPVSGNVTVGTLNSLLATNNVSVGSLLDAVVTLAGQSQLLSTNATLLSAVQTKLGLSSLPSIALGTAGSTKGLFASITAPDDQTGSALDTQVSALSLISTAIGVATSKYAVSLSSLNLNILLATVTAQASIIEPPSIGIGGKGATAFTGQVRTYLRVQTSNALLGALLAPLVSLDLPIIIDVAAATGTVNDLCTDALKDSSGNDRAKIDISAALVKICAGGVDTSTIFSTSTSCDLNVTNKLMLNVLGLLQFNGKIVLNALPASGSATLAVGQTQTVGNSLAIGSTVSSLVSQLLAGLLGGTPSSSSPTGTQTANLANQLWNDTASVCSQDTPVCRNQRLAQAQTNLQNAAASSGLLGGLLGGLTALLTNIANPCTGLLFLGGSAAGCVSMLQTAVSSSATTNGTSASNSISILVGILKPTLDAIGSSVLTPLLSNVLGLNLGNTDVKLMGLQCNAEPWLVN